MEMTDGQKDLIEIGSVVVVPQKAYPTKDGKGTVYSMKNGYADVSVDSGRWTVLISKLNLFK